MKIDLSEEAIARFQAFSDKHCGGKEPRLDLLLAMCAALGLRLRAVSAEQAES